MAEERRGAAATLDEQFHFLDPLPEALFETVLTTRHGALAERVAGILIWRRALLAGRLPDIDATPWPEAAITRRLLPRLETGELPPLCAGEEALTDHVLGYLCAAVDRIEQRREQGVEDQFDDLLARSRHRGKPGGGAQADAAPDADRDEGGNGSLGPDRGDPAAEVEPPAQAGSEALSTGLSSLGDGAPVSPPGQGAEAVDSASDAAAAIPASAIGDIGGAAGADSSDSDAAIDWGTLAANWRQTDALFKGMAGRLGRGWDLAQGQPSIGGWRDFVALRRWMAGRPELVALVDSLGRGSDADAAGAPPGRREQPVEADAEPAPMPRPQATPDRADAASGRPVHCPTDTRGLTRSDEIARMLPQEAASLGHPVLHRLWHARRSEQALLTYRVEGVLSEHRLQPEDAPAPATRSEPEPDAERGPLICCIDSSASMHGEPETLAKAVCLEVVRLANQQRRACLLYAFSGPGQLQETRLAFSPGGLRRIIRFLQHRFSGGTDIETPLRQALDRLRSEPWSRADLLVVSDGRFPLSDGLLRRVRQQRERSGLRVRGIATGGWSASGLDRLCDSVLRVDRDAQRSRR